VNHGNFHYLSPLSNVYLWYENWYSQMKRQILVTIKKVSNMIYRTDLIHFFLISFELDE
jgi:hypothetical protein